MEKYIYDEKNGLWFELQGDYYLPCLKLPEGEQQPVGSRDSESLLLLHRASRHIESGLAETSWFVLSYSWRIDGYLPFGFVEQLYLNTGPFYSLSFFLFVTHHCNTYRKRCAHSRRALDFFMIFSYDTCIQKFPYFSLK